MIHLHVLLGQVLSGEDAPTMSQLASWLEQHPGWEAVPRDEDDEEDSEEDSDEDSQEQKKSPEKSGEASTSKTGPGDEIIKETISKAKVEDDEYKLTEEQTYYR